jgi:hypothetical protein
LIGGVEKPPNGTATKKAQDFKDMVSLSFIRSHFQTIVVSEERFSATIKLLGISLSRVTFFLHRNNRTNEIMTNFSDEDDDFLMETKDFLQRVTKASQSEPQSAEAEEPEPVDVSRANTQAWLMKVGLVSRNRLSVIDKVWFLSSCLSHFIFTTGS